MVYENARTALENCYAIDECKSWADKAAAIASYARQIQDESSLNFAQQIRGRAWRQMGELLKQIEPQRGANQNIQDDDLKVTRKEAANKAGLSERQRKDSLRVASIPKSDFEELVESETPPTTTQLAALGTVTKLIDRLWTYSLNTSNVLQI